MENLSLKLNYFKKKLKLTNQKISELADIPVATVERISSGRTKNPNLKTLIALSNLFNCTLDDLVYFREENLQTYYFDEKTAGIAKTVNQDETLNVLFDAAIKLSSDNKQAVCGLAQRLLSLQ